ncbi:heme exporter protein CcmD [Ketobacter sp. MCCC 1A13808]|uniref:heme exporter protein CcmD n=1 Tax=Ketobacter sp. MCCC 1A13808 TaxID=2602738 RepID=UPI000F0E23A5|nr:heme exporter protein CcmD [Ketobacter sp. MCCC 1A13808]MVF10879.1 heme exporter protein CcmD [Ketobacter sp. MCCC 1A13808]RLP56276.1 MAG: heme exporter protein CcmD [Ketobacter sp.]
MEFDSFQAFMQMGKHGAFVWSAYGITLVVILGNLIAIRRRKKNVIETIQRKIKREQAGL